VGSGGEVSGVGDVVGEGGEEEGDEGTQGRVRCGREAGLPGGGGGNK